MSEPQPQFEKRSIPWHWIVLGLLVVGHAGIGAYLYGTPPTEIGRSGELVMGGVLMSQPILLAFWAGFASQPFRQRFLWAFLLSILVAFAEELGLLLNTHRSGSGVVMTLFFGLFAVTTVLLLIIRRVSRWQIKHLVIEDARSDYEPNQFGIKHLIILISITALACGLARSLVLLNSGLPLRFSVLPFVVGMVETVCFLFPAIVIPWCVMAYRPRIVLLIVTWTIIWVVCTIGGCVIIAIPQGWRGGSVFEHFFKQWLLIQLGAGLSMLISSIVMRSCGFRMVRMPKGSLG